MADPGPRQGGAGEPMSRAEERRALERSRLEAAMEQARHERDLAQWRIRRLRDRRAWRIFEALVAAVRSPGQLLTLPLTILRIVTDRREAPPRPAPPDLSDRPELTRPSPLPAVRRARSALEQGQYSQALEAATEALEIDALDVRALEVAWRSHDALGDITLALEMVRRQRAVLDRSWLDTAERRLQGELIALDPRWGPWLVPFEGTSDGPLLLVEGGPGTGQGRAADLVRVPAQHDLAALYQLGDLPLDSATQDLAWWAARSAREHRPRAIAARLTADLRPAIAADAIARAGQLPLWLVDTGAEPVDGTADSERARARRDRAARLRANAVVISDAALHATADPGAR